MVGIIPPTQGPTVVAEEAMLYTLIHCLGIAICI